MMPPSTDILQKIFPVSGLLVIGAGSHFEIDYVQPVVSAPVILVEAEVDRANSLAERSERHENWLVLQRLLAAQSGKTIFHHSNNPRESGLLSAESLNPVWRNLVSTEEELMAITLQELLKQKQVARPAREVNWVHVDCLPAVDILRGAGNFLLEWDAIIARVILPPKDTGDLKSSGQIELDAYLSEHDFVPVAQSHENNPAIGSVVYIKDWRKKHFEARQQLQVQNDALSKANLVEQKRSKQVKQLECNQQKQKHSELAKQMKAHEAEKLEFAKRIQEANTHLDAVKSAKEEVEKRLKLKQADLEHLRLRYAQVKNELDAARDILQEIHADIEAAKQLAEQIETNQ